MNLLTNSNITKTQNLRIEDSVKAISIKKQKTPNYRYIMHRLEGFSEKDYNDMEYDLSEIARIIDTEAYVQAAFRKKRQLILKNGFKFESKSERNLNYIKKRLEDFEYVTSQTFQDLLSEMTENIVNFSNCFILKYRKEESSNGLIRYRESGSEIKPIAGLFVLAAPTIDTAANPKTGQIVKYRHRIREPYSRQFKPEDIFHMFDNKRVGMTIGTPVIEAVKDDIFLLRSIEQNTEALINRHANPFTLIRVGTDKFPARVLGDGMSEIDVYADLLDNMDEEGGAAVPHRVDVKYLGAESQALRLEPYLNIFKQRVLSGIAIAESDFGNGSNISGTSGEIVSHSLKEDVRSLQTTIENFVSNYIFNEILLESPYYRDQQWIPEKERVYIKFLEPDFDKKIKIESHYLLMYTSGLISQEAALKKLDLSLEDKGIGQESSNSNNNSVKNSISNNIIEPKNQHNIKDSLNMSTYKSITNYYHKEYEGFLQNLLEYFEEDIILSNETYIRKIYERLDLILRENGVETVNNYVEDSIFSLLSENT